MPATEEKFIIQQLLNSADNSKKAALQKWLAEQDENNLQQLQMWQNWLPKVVPAPGASTPDKDQVKQPAKSIIARDAQKDTSTQYEPTPEHAHKILPAFLNSMQEANIKLGKDVTVEATEMNGVKCIVITAKTAAGNAALSQFLDDMVKQGFLKKTAGDELQKDQQGAPEAEQKATAPTPFNTRPQPPGGKS